MVRKHLRGASLMTTLLLITIVMLVAATMAGVFTMNMNITQRASNGSVALSEAEAGIAEVLYQITRDENIEGDGNEENPKVNWGRNGETIRGTITPGLNDDEAYHVVTFDPGSSFPHSTNNTYLDRNSGSLGRTIPDGMIHIVSTGYCKGQYRTVECLIEKPPFPFGLATSGPIVSLDPIIVKGVSSLAGFDPDEEGDRPGHLLCNSPEGIKIGRAEQQSTEITGFVKSSGPVEIEQPAVVRGGVRSFADQSTIVDLNIQDFNLLGQPGVVTLLDSQYDEALEMDVMYHYSGSHLHFMRETQLNQAMLYVQGDLTIHGPVHGEGLIVVDGNATFKSGTALAGSNKMAVLASGDITIEGNNNYFMGLVYCEGNLDASNITIVGNTVVNSADASKGKATLENVTIVSNEETADMTITITSSSQLVGGKNPGQQQPPMGNMGLSSSGGGIVGPYDQNPNGYVGTIDIGDIGYHKNDMKALFWDLATNGNPFPEWVSPTNVSGEAAELWATLEQIYNEAKIINEQAKRINNLKDLMQSLGPTHPDYANLEADLQSLEAEMAIMSSPEVKDALDQKIEGYVDSVYDYVASYTDSDLSADDGVAVMDIDVDQRFNLNEYHPESEKIKMSFWRVYPRRM